MLCRDVMAGHVQLQIPLLMSLMSFSEKDQARAACRATSDIRWLSTLVVPRVLPCGRKPKIKVLCLDSGH